MTFAHNLHSQATRRARRARAHQRTLAGVRGKAKHRIMFLSPQGPRLARAVVVFGEPVQVPYEGHATQPRPWVTRAKRRIVNKRARASRKANRG